MPTFRPMNLETDAAELARLYNYTVPEPITSETAHAWWTVREGEIRSTVLAMDESGETIGYWDVDRETWMKPGHFFLKVIVTPDQRWRGLGTQMYGDALRFARGNGATHLESKVFETDAASLEFAKVRGFKILHHSFNSSLDLTSFDEHRFDLLMDRLHSKLKTESTISCASFASSSTPLTASCFWATSRGLSGVAAGGACAVLGLAPGPVQEPASPPAPLP